MEKVSASIINWNNRDYILDCIESLLAQKNVELDPVVIDNGSTDGSVDLIRAKYPTLKIILTGKNLGFSAAHNIGYRSTSGAWHLILNSDVKLEPDYLSTLLQSCHDKSVGSAQGKLLRFERDGGKNIIDSAGIEMFQSRRVWDRGSGETDVGQYDLQEEVFGACAAASLYRRAMLEQIAPDGEIFAEIYFAYYEDVDLAWRIGAAEWKQVYIPQALARHIRGGSTKGSEVTRRLVFRNRYILLARNETCFGLAKNIVPIFIFEVFQFIRLCKYPSLFLSIPQVWSKFFEALKSRKKMTVSGRQFGLRNLSKFVAKGSGVSSWIKAK